MEIFFLVFSLLAVAKYKGKYRFYEILNKQQTGCCIEPLITTHLEVPIDNLEAFFSMVMRANFA